MTVGHGIARTAMPFGHAPGLPGGQWFGNGAWYLCGEQCCPEAVGKLPGATRCGWANVAVAKVPGASFVSWGESRSHENRRECCCGLQQSQNFSLSLYDMAMSQGLAHGHPSDLLQTRAGSCWFLNWQVRGTKLGHLVA